MAGEDARGDREPAAVVDVIAVIGQKSIGARSGQRSGRSPGADGAVVRNRALDRPSRRLTFGFTGLAVLPTENWPRHRYFQESLDTAREFRPAVQIVSRPPTSFVVKIGDPVGGRERLAREGACNHATASRQFRGHALLKAPLAPRSFCEHPMS